MTRPAGIEVGELVELLLDEMEVVDMMVVSAGIEVGELVELLLDEVEVVDMMVVSAGS